MLKLLGWIFIIVALIIIIATEGNSMNHDQFVKNPLKKSRVIKKSSLLNQLNQMRRDEGKSEFIMIDFSKKLQRK